MTRFYVPERSIVAALLTGFVAVLYIAIRALRELDLEVSDDNIARLVVALHAPVVGLGRELEELRREDALARGRAA